MIVIDASAALRWFVAVATEPAPAWRPAQGRVLIAPDLFVIEVRSAALKYVRAGALTPEAASDMLAAIDQIVPTLVPMAAHKDMIWQLARELDHSPYDCAYLALSLHHDTRMVTADKRLVSKLKGTRHDGRAIHIAGTQD